MGLIMSTARLRSYRFAAVILAVACIPATARAQASNPAAGEGSKLAERDRLREQSERLSASGDIAGAIAAAESVLAIERKVLPEGHADQLGSLDRLAALDERHGDFTRAIGMRRETLAIARRAFPENDWRVTDARLALADAEKLASMSPSQRAQVAEAARLDDESSKMYTAGRFAEAVGPAKSPGDPRGDSGTRAPPHCDISLQPGEVAAIPR